MAGARKSQQRGAVSLEYAGAIAIAALVVGTVGLSVAGPDNRIGREVSSAVCRIVTLGQGGCEPPPASANDRKPPEPCVVNASGYDANVMAAAGVQVGKNQKFLIEQLSDGTYRVTRGTGGDLGGEVGAGFDVSATWDSKSYGASATAGANASLAFGEGEVYNLPNQDAVQDLIAAHVADNVKDQVANVAPPGMGVLPKQLNPVRGAIDFLSDKVGVPKLPEPDETFTEGGVTASAMANATRIAANAQAGLGVQGMLGVRQGADGSTTTYYSATLTGNAGAGTWGGNGKGDIVYAEASAEGRLDAAVEVVRDKGGNITAVSVKSRAGGRAVAGENVDDQTGVASETTVTLPVESAEDARVASNFLGSLNMGPVPGLPPSVPNPTAGSPAGINPFTVGQSTADFINASRDRGHITQQDFSTDDSKYGLMFDAKWLLEVGLGGQVTTTSSQTAGGRYFDGQKWAEWEGCGA